MALRALVFFLGAGLLCAGRQGGRLHIRQQSIRQPICYFNTQHDGQTLTKTASDNNVIFRSNHVLVVQDGTQRVMLFFQEAGSCHEQAEVECGDLSAQSRSNFLLQNSGGPSPHRVDASSACASRQACTPDTTPNLSCMRSMIGGAIAARKGKFKRIANIGLGAGTIALYWSREAPHTKMEAIDISGDVIAAAPCFGVRQGANLRLVQSDGRKYIESQKDGSYDIVFLDAYDDHSMIPPCLKTVEFFQMISKKLAPGGVLSMNVWRRELDAVYTAFATAFPGRTQAGKSPGLRNIVLLGRAKGGASTTPVDDAVMDADDSASRDGTDFGSAWSWAAEAEFGSKTESLLRSEGHVLTDHAMFSGGILHDSDICPSFANSH